MVKKLGNDELVIFVLESMYKSLTNIIDNFKPSEEEIKLNLERKKELLKEELAKVERKEEDAKEAYDKIYNEMKDFFQFSIEPVLSSTNNYI